MPQKRKNKRTHKTKSKKSKKLNRQKVTTLILSFLVITLMVTIASYFFLPTNNINQNQTIISDIEKNYQEYNKKQNKQINYEEIEEKIETPKTNTFQDYTKEFEKDYANVEEIKKDIIDIIQKSKKIEKVVVDKIETLEKDVSTKIKEVSEEILQTKEVIVPPVNNKPKLAIVIDDVTLQSQVNNIQKINHDITMSFMPPIKTHKNSAKIAQPLDFYMVHFPMQANSFKFEETNTLHVGDSYEKIENRVKQIRQWYPNAIYTNNHTGSKFTSDDQSMDYLIKALTKYDFIFLDSRTTANTKTKKYAKKYKVPYLARNIFLDNKLEYNYILSQLKKSIKIAKKSGYAVAIGHPHKITLKVLKEAEPLFKDLNLVYVDKIPKYNP